MYKSDVETGNNLRVILTRLTLVATPNIL